MVEDRCTRVGTTDGKKDYYLRTATICECWVGDEDAGDNDPVLARAEANARLIACAPELLAMVQRYASECAECDGTGMFRHFNPRRPEKQAHGEDCDACRDIRNLIAKATGQ